jgi:hypothetical protein
MRGPEFKSHTTKIKKIHLKDKHFWNSYSYSENWLFLCFRGTLHFCYWCIDWLTASTPDPRGSRWKDEFHHGSKPKSSVHCKITGMTLRWQSDPVESPRGNCPHRWNHLSLLHRNVPWQIPWSHRPKHLELNHMKGWQEWSSLGTCSNSDLSGQQTQ